MNRTKLVPLFPLNTVLFPHAAVPLQIFEERYLRMVNDCIENDSEFGIVLLRSGEEAGGSAEPYEVGTLARITRLQHLEGGRLYLLALGEQRFRVLQLVHELPYLQAIVEIWDENPDTEGVSDELAVEVAAFFESYLQQRLSRFGVETSRVELPDNPTQLSFAVASTLQTTLSFKQYLLELQDTSERLRLLLKVLQDQTEVSYTQTYDPDEWELYLSRN